MAKKRRKLTVVQKLMRKADRSLSAYIRAYFEKESKLCPLCKIKPIKCCFHIVRRGRKAVRWDHRNVIATCFGCNLRELHDPDPSRAYFIRRFGVKLYLKLVDKSRESFVPEKDYLEGVIKKYDRMRKKIIDRGEG